MGTGELLGKPSKLRGSDLRWTSIPSRGSRITPSPFHATKTEISSGSYEPVLALRLHFMLRYVIFTLRCVINRFALSHLKTGALFPPFSLKKNGNKFTHKQKVQNIFMLLFCLFYFLRKEREHILPLHLSLQIQTDKRAEGIKGISTGDSTEACSSICG